MSTDTNEVVTAFPQGRKSNAFPKLGVRKEDPRLEALLGKLVSVSEGQPRAANRQNIRPPDQGLLQKIADDNSQASIDAKNLLQILPDIDLSMLILISSILSPKDMVHTELTYKVDKSGFTSELAGQLIQLVKEHFDSTYKITELLPEILKDALFMTGSYALAVLPESTIDDVINGKERVSVESLRGEFAGNHLHALGLLGRRKSGEEETIGSIGLESLNFNSPNSATTYDPAITPPSGTKEGLAELLAFVTVVDNPNVLKMPSLRDKIRQDRVQDALGSRNMSMEGFDEINNRQRNSIYRRRRYRTTPILAVKPASTLEKPTYGNPLVMHMPSEAVIPVHVPGSPEDHIGYFVLLDENGNPLNRVLESNYYRDLTNSMDRSQQSSNLIQSARQGFTGINMDNAEELKRLDDTYSDLMEAELRTRLQFGLYGNDVEISKDHHVYRIMLARSLAKMHTQILYIPEELMTYIAFDYNAHGVGISLLEKSKIIGSLRATLMFANTMASIKNSLGRTLLNITLDPEDPDPSTTVETLVNEFAKNTRSQLPVGIANPADIVTTLQNGAVDIAVTGNTRYPETKMEVEDKQSNRAGPNTELEEAMRKRHIQTMSLTPEMVDNGNNADFAATIIQNNLLLAKRVMMYQSILTAGVSDFLRKYILNSEDIMNKLRDVMTSNRDKFSKTSVDEMKDDIRETANVLKSGGRLANAYTAKEGGLQETLVDHALDRILFDFITALYVTLPDPDILTLKNQSQAFEDYSESIKKAIDVYIDASFMDDKAVGDMAGIIDQTKAAILTHYQRQWLRENNLFPELEELVTVDDDGVPGIDLMKSVQGHSEGLQKTINGYVQKLLASRKANEAVFKATQTATGVQIGGGSGGDFGGSDDGGEGGDPGADPGGDGDDDTSAADSALGGLDSIDIDGTDAQKTDTTADATSTDTDESSSSSTETSADGTTTTTSSSSSSQSNIQG